MYLILAFVQEEIERSSTMIDPNGKPQIANRYPGRCGKPI